MRWASTRTGSREHGRPPVRGHPRNAAAAPRKESRRESRLDALTEELKEVARRLGIQVRQERLIREVGYHARSGLCRLDEEEILLLDHDLSREDQIDLLLEVLATRDLKDVQLSEEAARLVAGASAADPARARAGASVRGRGGVTHAHGRAPGGRAPAG